MELQTNRLQIIAATSALGHAELENRKLFAHLLNAAVPSNWPPPLNDDASMAWFTNYLESNSNSSGWACWYFLLRMSSGERIAIGNGGFKGKPNNEGIVEVGYSVLEEYQRNGYATEAVRALVQWGFSHTEVTQIIAHTFPDLKLSIRVLEKSGFTYAGKGVEEGTVKYQLLRENYLRSDSVNF